MAQCTLLLLPFCLALLLSAAQQPIENPFEPPRTQSQSVTNPVIREVSPGVFEVGTVSLNKKEGKVSFPAMLNLDAGIVEYLLVSEAGKLHESVLRTTAEPLHVNLALLLLGLKGSGTNAFPTNPAAIKGDKVNIEVSWSNLQKELRVPGEQLVVNRETGQPLAKGPWVYNGSEVFEGTFLAQIDGSIIAVMLDSSAIINNPRPDAERDDLWMVNTNGLPPLNWPVTVTIQLQRAK